MTIEEIQAANEVLANKIRLAMQEYYDETKFTACIATGWTDISTFEDRRFMPSVQVSVEVE